MLLELDRVSKGYTVAGTRVRALDGVSLTLRRGELLCLHGPSGSGKTTLLALIATLLAPDAGTIRFGGRDLAELSESEASAHLRRHVGFVAQSPQLMPRVSALENACVKLLLDGATPRQARMRARPWLERLGLAERLEHTPEQLSAGERQRLAIARALAIEPPLVLADEPTANLDSATSLEIVQLLAALAHERDAGVVLVTHDGEAAALADRVCKLRDGALSGAAHGRSSEASHGRSSGTVAPAPA
ncbi:MAG: ABC transporter ATP-binding protein, partial [Solirubrobacteraceae bacterium]